MIAVDASTKAIPPQMRKPPRKAIEWVVRELGGGSVLAIERLRGGFSHASHVIRLDTGSAEPREVVLRRWARPDWQEEDPEFTPQQEVATYGLLAGSVVLAPRLLGADVEGRECDVPAILLTRAPGARVRKPGDMGSFLAQLAAALPPLHAIDPARAAQALPPYRPYFEPERLTVPSWTKRPALWERAIEVSGGREPEHSSAFIHRDYHPGNTLWADGRLTAVVDWTTAEWGSIGVDLAHMRLNLAVLFSLAVADRFLEAYGSAVGCAYRLDPYWDIRDAVDFAPRVPPGFRSVAQLARLDEFVARALARL